MKRGPTKKTSSREDIQVYNQKVQALSELVSRTNLAFAMGKQYGGDRDVYRALGYDLDLTYEKYLARYARQAMARAIINRPIGATWQGDVGLMEADKKAEDTALEKAWTELSDNLALVSKFTRADRLTCLGRFGILLLGLNDVKDAAGLKEPVLGKNLKLLYVKPLGEGSTEIESTEQDPSNERYGLPLLYKINVQDEDTNKVQELRVHHSRIIHIAGELLESEIYGAPKLQSVYNNLMDLDKIVGGSGEMFWRSARPGMQGKVDEDFEITPAMEADLQKQMDEFEHNLRRALVNKGITFEQFQMQLADPTASVDVQVQMISAVTGIPKRILTGTERGELASTQDTEAWHSLIFDRREEYAEPQIVRPFVDRCIDYGILPAPKGKDNVKYTVTWADLWELSTKEKAEVGKTRATAIKDWGNAAVGTDAIPMKAVPKLILGLDDEDAEWLIEIQQSAEAEEEREMRQAEEDVRIEAEMLARQQQPPPVEGED